MVSYYLASFVLKIFTFIFALFNTFKAHFKIYLKII